MRHKHDFVEQHAEADDRRATIQVLATLLPLAALWYAAVLGAAVSWWLAAAAALAIILFLMRVFVLMHECGHRSLFRTPVLNSAFGFVFGVLSGMPQYVWSKHHAYHHATNGNWAKYGGPLSIVTVEEYAAMSAGQQRRYRRMRNIWITPLAGFLYVIFNPRWTWLKGSAALLRHLLAGKPAAQFQTPYWASRQEYWHMFWNNIVLLAAWAAMSWAVGAALFFAVYLASSSLAGAAGIVLFTAQHNFEHSYASGDEGWDYDEAALLGTSFLILPRWLNWFTASIAYHHIHHLSASIPNYRLAQCHEENRHLFTDVPRMRLSQIPASFKYILRDTQRRRIVSVAEASRIAQLLAIPWGVLLID